MFRMLFHKSNVWRKAILKSGILLFALMLISFISQSQSCLPDGIEFTTQSQIDSFPINYPGCTEIEGSVEISGGDISDLSGLSNINSIGGNLLFVFCSSLYSLEGLEELSAIDSALVFQQNSSLSSLSGLENLSSIGTGLVILGNSSLINLSGLEGLTSVGNLVWIQENYALSSLTGLEGLTTIGGSLMILISNALNNLQGLDGLTNIGGEFYFSHNNDLSSLTGLESLVSIGGGIRCWSNNSLIEISSLYGLTEVGGQLSIRSNDALISLDGLDNIAPASISDLDISLNDLLSTCHVQSVCDYLANPTGSVVINYNAQGCNSPEEVQDSCIANGVNIDEKSIFTEIKLYPNPTSSQITISGAQGTFDEINIYNRLGQKVLHEVNSDETINVSALPQGLYIVEIFCDDHHTRQKLLIQK